MDATSTFIVLKELAGNAPPHLNDIQLLLAPYMDTLISLWRTVWVVTLACVITVYIRAWRAHQQHRTHE